MHDCELGDGTHELLINSLTCAVYPVVCSATSIMNGFIFRAAIAAALVASIKAQCSVCGPGLAVGLPDATFTFAEQPSVPCGALEQAGINGMIPLDQCGFLPEMIKVECGCGVFGGQATSPVPAPIPQPVSAPIPEPLQDGDCFCYGDIQAERSLFAEKPAYVRRNLREVRKENQRIEALRALTKQTSAADTEEEDCECYEECDDDYAIDDDVPAATDDDSASTDDSPMGKGGKGSSPGGKEPSDDDDDSAPTDDSPMGKGGKGSSPGGKVPTDDSPPTLEDDDCVCSCFRGECKYCTIQFNSCSHLFLTHSSTQVPAIAPRVTRNRALQTVRAMAEREARHLPMRPRWERVARAEREAMAARRRQTRPRWERVARAEREAAAVTEEMAARRLQTMR